MQQSIIASWATYAKHRDVFKNNLAICLNRPVYNSCVLPAMTYDAETWTLSEQAHGKLAAAQTKTERCMLNITYKDRRANIWVRDTTKVIDIINRLKDLTCHHLDTIRQEKATRETSQAAERRPGQILERQYLTENST